MTIGHEPTKLDNALMILAIGVLVLLGIAMTQPVWRGGEMVTEFKSNCDKIGGVVLESKNMFGTGYSCRARLD